MKRPCPAGQRAFPAQAGSSPTLQAGQHLTTHIVHIIHIASWATPPPWMGQTPPLPKEAAGFMRRTHLSSTRWPPIHPHPPTCVMSGQPTYEDTTRLPGAMTTSSPALAAIDSESLPPSHAMPRSIITSLQRAACMCVCVPKHVHT